MSDDDFKADDLKDKPAKAVDPMDEVKKAMADDPIGKYMPAIMKYAPTVMKVVKGFADSMAEKQKQQAMLQMQMQQQQQMQQPQQPQVLPPEGWNELSELQRYQRKYDGSGNISAWYKQGEVYEDFRKGLIQPQSHSPVQYQQPSFNQPPVQAVPPQQPRSVNGNLNLTPADTANIPRADMVQPTQSNNPVVEEEKEQEPTKEEIMEHTKELENTMIEDNKKYLKIAIDHINSLSIDDFEDYVDDTTLLASKFKQFEMFIPTSVKKMISEITLDQFEEIVKAECVTKYKWLEKEGKTSSIKLMFEQVKKVIK